MEQFFKRLKSPVVISGVIAQLVVILLLLDFDPADIEVFRLVAMAVLQMYIMLFVSTNNAGDRNHY